MPVCSVCTYRARAFAPVGFDYPVISELQIIGAGRRNVMCPQCGATDRDRLMLLMLTRTPLFPLHPGTAVLHLAPERVLYLHLRERQTREYVTGDLDPSRYPWAKGHIQTLDVTQLPFQDGRFHYVIANHILEHISDDRRAMAELFRVMAPGGRAILQVPLSPVLETTREDPSITTPQGRALAFGQDDHVRIYTEADYRTRLESVGFRVTFAMPEIYASELTLHCLDPRERVAVATKPIPTATTA